MGHPLESAKTDLAFEPDGFRASRLDHHIRVDLARSLEYLSSRCQDIISFDAESLRKVIQGLKAGAKYPPACFGIYAHLVFALLQNDHEKASELLARLTRLHEQPTQSQILCLDDPGLAPDRQLIEALIDFLAQDAASMRAAEPEALDRFLEDHRCAMRMIDADLPELAAEIKALVSQLILVWIPNDGVSLNFDGGSAPMLWGGMFINAARQRTPLELLEVLVHESAHLLLYAFTQHEPLVLNDEAERYTSPLRRDPRPMEGIFHATWVSARMAYAMHTLAHSPRLDAALRHQALAATQVDITNFAAGHAVIQSHARLTETGRQLIDAAAAAMQPISFGFPAEP
jgi:hypothetical protein